MKKDVYRCPTCKKKYRRRETSYSCCVQHAPGDCCHAFEQRVSKKGWAIPSSDAFVIRSYVPPIGSSSTSMAPWCGICAGWHIPGAGPCTATYS